MRARDVNINGPLVITNPPSPPTTSMVPAAGNNLSGIVSSSGDFKNPRPQEYTKSTYSNLFGYAWTDIFGTLFTTTGYIRPAANCEHIVSASEADLAALENLYQQIRGNVDLSIDLYQIKQTQQTVVKAVRLVTQMRKSLIGMIKSKPRDWGGTWLEYVYGVKPTLSTIFESLEKIKKPETVWYDIRARSTSTNKRTDTVSMELPGIPFLAVKESSNRIEYRCKFAMSNSALESLAGFSSLNPVSFAWEVLPYSFVVDWFVNVGGYLRATESALLYNQAFVSGYKTSVVKSRCGSILKGTYSPFPGFVYIYNATGETTLATKRRTILLGAPMPDVPRFKVDLGSGRLLNAAALLSQLLK